MHPLCQAFHNLLSRNNGSIWAFTVMGGHWCECPDSWMLYCPICNTAALGEAGLPYSNLLTQVARDSQSLPRLHYLFHSNQAQHSAQYAKAGGTCTSYVFLLQCIFVWPGGTHKLPNAPSSCNWASEVDLWVYRRLKHASQNGGGLHQISVDIRV